MNIRYIFETFAVCYYSLTGTHCASFNRTIISRGNLFKNRPTESLQRALSRNRLDEVRGTPDRL